MNITFKYSCVPFLRRDCAVGSKHIDPCSCAKFYECDTDYRVRLRSCADGTLYDHNKNTCEASNDVLMHEICSSKEPWLRCQFKYGANMEDIVQRCKGVVETKPTVEAAPLNMQSESTGGVASNPGLIVGFCAGILLALLFVAIFILYFKSKDQQTRLSGRNTKDASTVENPSYICTNDFMSPLYNGISNPPSSGPNSHEIATNNQNVDDHAGESSIEHRYEEILPTYDYITVDDNRSNRASHFALYDNSVA